MSKRVYCIASFEAKDGLNEELFKVLQSLEPQTIREDGCIQYIVTKHISHPNATGKSFPIVFNEIWESQEAFELHCNKPYIKEFLEKINLPINLLRISVGVENIEEIKKEFEKLNTI